MYVQTLASSNNPGGGHCSSTHLTDGHTEAQGGAGPRVWALMASVPMRGEVWVEPAGQDSSPLRRAKGQHFCVPLPECGVVAFTHRVVVSRRAELQTLRQQSCGREGSSAGQDRAHVYTHTHTHTHTLADTHFSHPLAHIFIDVSRDPHHRHTQRTFPHAHADPDRLGLTNLHTSQDTGTTQSQHINTCICTQTHVHQSSSIHSQMLCTDVCTHRDTCTLINTEMHMCR